MPICLANSCCQKITTIFFDCFNTLIDDFDSTGSEWGLGCIAESAVKRGVADSATGFRDGYLGAHQSWFKEDYVEMSLIERLRSAFPDADTSALTELVALFEQRYPDTIRFDERTREMLEVLSRRYTLAVVSNYFIPGMVKVLLNQVSIDHYFQVIVSSVELGTKKPGAEIYRHTQQVLGVEPGEVLFVGDNLRNDVLRPIDYGMQAIYYDRSGERPGCQSPPDGVAYITGWNELTDWLG